MPDVGEFVFVRRNGTQFLVAAFRQKDYRVVYVTREGSLRSLPVADFDVEATLRLNEDRGTDLHLH